MQHFHPRERVTYLGREVEASLKRVDRIITDSDYIKAEIISYFAFRKKGSALQNWHAAKNSGRGLPRTSPRFWLIMVCLR